ncbi:hypothetical protein Tco_1422563 [Tanacetum coccineum]
MTRNMSYLSDFKEFDGGYVIFGGGAKGGKITSNGTLKTDVRTASTPMDTKNPLLKDSDGDDVDVHLYRSMIGSLMYLTLSRPDIMFTVCACARFQVTPKVSHLHNVKRIFSKLGYEVYNRGLLVLRMQINIMAVQEANCVATSSTKAEYMGPVVQGEGSTHPVESHHTPTSAPSTSQPPVSPTSRRTTKQESVVPQPRSPTQTPIADKAASIGVDVRYGGATTTVTGLEAGHGNDTDITNNTRKCPKPEKHGHENGKECTSAGDLIAEVSSKWST